MRWRSPLLATSIQPNTSSACVIAVRAGARADAGRATAAHLAGRRHARLMARLTVVTSLWSCADATGARA